MHHLGFVTPRTGVAHHHLVQLDAVGAGDEGAERRSERELDVGSDAADLVAAGELPGEDGEGVWAVVTVPAHDHAGIPLGEQRQIQRLDREGHPTFPHVRLAAVGVPLAAHGNPRHVVVRSGMDDGVGEALGAGWVSGHDRVSWWWLLVSQLRRARARAAASGQHRVAQGRQRDHAVRQDPVVERSNVEVGRPLGLVPDPVDLETPDHVGQGLGRHADVAIDFTCDLYRAQWRVGADVVDCLLAGPAERMHPGVDHEATGSHRVRGEHAHPRQVAAVEPHLVAQAFGIEPPALQVGVDAEVDLCRVQRGRLAESRDLQVMAGDRLVERDRLELIGRPRRGVGGVEEEARRLPRGEIGRGVEGERPAGDLVGQALGGGKGREPGGRSGGRTLERCGCIANDAITRPVLHGWVVSKSGVDLRDAVRAQERTGHLDIFGFEALDLLEPDLVDLLRGQIDRRVSPDQMAVLLVASVEVAVPRLVVGTPGRAHPAQDLGVGSHRRPDVVGDDALDLGPPDSGVIGRQVRRCRLCCQGIELAVGPGHRCLDRLRCGYEMAAEGNPALRGGRLDLNPELREDCRQAPELLQVAVAMIGRDEREAAEEGRQGRVEAEGRVHQRLFVPPGELVRRGTGGEGDGFEQHLLAGRNIAGQLVGTIGESTEVGLSLGDRGRAQIFPLLEPVHLALVQETIRLGCLTVVEVLVGEVGRITHIDKLPVCGRATDDLATCFGTARGTFASPTVGFVEGCWAAMCSRPCQTRRRPLHEAAAATRPMGRDDV